MPVLDPSRPYSAELHVIRRLNSSLRGAGARVGLGSGRQNSPSVRLWPPAEPLPLSPLRLDVPLLDPCCGHLSAGAEVDLGLKGRPRFIDFHHVASALRVPPTFRERAQTASSHSGICANVSGDKSWKSRRIPDAVLETSLSGAHSPDGTPGRAASRCNLPAKHTASQNDISAGQRQWNLNSPASQPLSHHAATQRSSEVLDWGAKLPQRPEKVADPVSERSSARRYHNRPQLWQSIGTAWNKEQLRLRNDAKKPISFCSGFRRSGQIPLYTGTIGSENMDNIDNVNEEFRPLTLKRSIIPAYTPTAHRTTIPGYTGKADYANYPPDAAKSVPAGSSPTHTSLVQGPAFGRAAPLSRAVTAVTPCNPFLRAALPASHRHRQRRH